ncbi:hypothetical protein [Calothrix sp. 336/3]|uniref:hypothetical protein n=1 Tax=Calothrix sp. 336/3 TaxID=1337936 RepID=UPI0004E46C1B|nr:hypothetical protein [Calothrix sp. 336/3]AKG22579.1 hypothetical protein IJ00_16055 [Calothrix sp. 336/3]
MKKYFFLSEGWSVGRIWSIDGLWQVTAWRRQPEIEKMNICLIEKGEVMWLYRVEEGIIMLEVKPTATEALNKTIGQVILRRLLTAEQVIEHLGSAVTKCQLQNIEAVVQ